MPLATYVKWSPDIMESEFTKIVRVCAFWRWMRRSGMTQSYLCTVKGREFVYHIDWCHALSLQESWTELPNLCQTYSCVGKSMAAYSQNTSFQKLRGDPPRFRM